MAATAERSCRARVRLELVACSLLMRRSFILCLDRLVNAVCDHPTLHWVCTRNEANASLMAAADAKLSPHYRLGACIATSGPGASNLVTGLLDAQLDRVPLIAITGTKPRSDAAHSEFQDIDQSRLFAAGGLAYSVTVSDPLQLVAVMRDAVAVALTQRACVHVAVPVDIRARRRALERGARPCPWQPRAARAFSSPACATADRSTTLLGSRVLLAAHRGHAHPRARAPVLGAPRGDPAARRGGTRRSGHARRRRRPAAPSGGECGAGRGARGALVRR